MVKEILIALLFAPLTAWAQADLIAKGEKVFADKKCVPCHAIKGKGGTVGPTARGPELSTVGAKRDAQWLRTYLKDPKAVNPKAKMMAFKGTDEELEALVAYMGSLK
jgi:mono/diheme cytochrome c family protein